MFSFHRVTSEIKPEPLCFRALGGRLAAARADLASRPTLPLRRMSAAAAAAAAAARLLPHVGQRHLGAALLVCGLERLQQQLAHLR